LELMTHWIFLTPGGILSDVDKVRVVSKFAIPKSVKQVRPFLGLSNYYRRFIKNYAKLSEPLCALIRDATPFGWDDSCQKAMDDLKSCLTSSPVLRFPDFGKAFYIHTDACDAGLGAALMQQDEDGREIVVAYASQTLNKSEKPYSTPEKECLVLIWALEYFRPYIDGLHVTVYMVQSSLQWLMSRPNPSGRLVRWCLRLQDPTTT
uniref:Reverse transcriptase/retrotransposon-derived protein RNase H-like domain-containing protein n=1 Tax=Sinocyclocheilus grahami TaxID=75366 RepID=A0A672LNT7_SINGR